METTKTTEKFKSVHQTFSYTPPSAWTNQWSSLAFGIGMIVVDYWRCTTAYHDIL